MAETKPGETKRVLISKAQRWTLLEVLVASLILGTCIVLVNFLVKHIQFNATVIGEKNIAISEYDQAIRNVGVCADADKNGRLSDAEIENCNPNEVPLSSVEGSLRYNVYGVMAENGDLESVARQRNENGICFAENGKMRDWAVEYNLASTDAAREQALQGMKLCSSLRVISDALPAQKNTEALMASLNQLFIVAGIEPESIAPTDELIVSDIDGVAVIPVSFRMQGTGAEVLHALDSIEKSIREFDITSASVEWTSGGLSLRANANAFYLGVAASLEAEKIVRAQ